MKHQVDIPSRSENFPRDFKKIDFNEGNLSSPCVSSISRS